MSEKTSFRELVQKISEQSGKNDDFTHEFMKELVRIIETALEENGSITISGFGKFELRWMEQRKGIHPQTHEEITIAAQNKVVFKPFKPLREHVNRPYARMKPQILEDAPVEKTDTGESETASPPAVREQTPGLPPAAQPEPKKDSDETVSPAEAEAELESEPDPFGITPPEKDPSEPLKPGSVESEKEKQGRKETDLPPFPFYLEEQEEDRETEDTDEELIVVRPSPVKQQKPAFEFDETPHIEEVQNNGRFRWSYLAAAIIILIIVIALYYFMTNRDDAVVQTVEVPEVEVVPDPGIPEPPPADIEETELIAIIVQGGQNFWNLALNYLGNAYLWPWIYYLNSDTVDDPNRIYSGIDLTIPVPENPEDLSDTDLREIALGYISVYQWYLEYEPGEARNYLWAAGSFYPEILDQVAGQVDPDDLNFARSR